MMPEDAEGELVDALRRAWLGPYEKPIRGLMAEVEIKPCGCEIHDAFELVCPAHEEPITDPDERARIVEASLRVARRVEADK